MAKKMAVRNKQKKEQGDSFWIKSEKKISADNKDEEISGGSRGFKIAFRLLGTVIGIFSLVLVTIQARQLWSNTWPVKSVLIIGDATHISEAEIRKIMASEDMGGMLSIDLVELHEQLLIHPWIKAATIRKQWPETLSFELEEFKAVARINDKLLLESGLSVKNGGIDINANLLRVVVDESRIGNNLNLLELVDKVGVMKSKLAVHHLELKIFEIDETNNWFIHIHERFKINLGRQQQQSRMERFFTVFAAIDNKLQLEHIDLRYRNGLSVKYKQDSSSSKSRS